MPMAMRGGHRDAPHVYGPGAPAIDGSNGTNVRRAASVFAGAEPKGRTYRLSNVSAIERIGRRTALPGCREPNVSASDVPPGAARWRPGAPRARAWRGNVMRGKRAMRLRMCDPADVRPDTPDRTRSRQTHVPSATHASSPKTQPSQRSDRLMELPRTSEGTTVYVLLIITCPVALQPDDPHIAAPSARTAARQQ